MHRFLGPDNFLSDPLDPRAYDRFAYAYNNPLSYVDYSGENVFKAILDFFVGVFEFFFGGVERPRNPNPNGNNQGLSAAQQIIIGTAVATGATIATNQGTNNNNMNLEQQANTNANTALNNGQPCPYGYASSEACVAAGYLPFPEAENTVTPQNIGGSTSSQNTGENTSLGNTAVNNTKMNNILV